LDQTALLGQLGSGTLFHSGRGDNSCTPTWNRPFLGTIMQNHRVQSIDVWYLHLGSVNTTLSGYNHDQDLSLPVILCTEDTREERVHISWDKVGLAARFPSLKHPDIDPFENVLLFYKMF
jgi:hypothetical protein